MRSYRWMSGWIWFILVLSTAVLGAQESAHRFQHLMLKDGLPNPSVLDIRQDAQGFMWFATFAGIARYDGYSMQTYRPRLRDPDSIALRNLPVLGEGPQGELLVGYGWGDCKLFRYDATLDRLEPYLYDTLSQRSLIPLNDGVQSLYTDSRGWLWIGTMGIGVFVVKQGGEFVHYPYCADADSPDCFPSPDVLGDMAEDREGNIWLPTFDGICKWEAATGAFRMFPFSNRSEEAPNQCFSLHFVPPSTLWAGSSYEGLVRFDTERETFQSYPLPLEVDIAYINDLAVLSDGKLALAINTDNFTSGSLLFDPATERWITLTFQEELFGSENTNYVDYAGNLWIGSWQRGVLKYDPNRRHFQRWNPSLLRSGNIAHPRPHSFTEDQAGNIWFGTANYGLFAWNPQSGQGQRYTMPPRVQDPALQRAVYSVHEAGPDTLWLGVADEVYAFSPATGRMTPLSLSWKGEQIADPELSKTGENDWWLSSWAFRGFCKLETSGDRLTVQYCYRSTDSDSLSALSGITALVQDPAGRLWIGNNQYGLYIFDPVSGQFDYHLPQYGVWDIHFDDQGLAWLATHSQGLKGYDPEQRRIIHLDAETAATISLSHGLLADRHGLLWMINDKGLVQFDPVTRKVKRKISAVNWRSIGESGYHRDQPALKTRSGAMIFGERHGAVYFHPDSLLLDTIPPRLVFTGFKLFNESVTPGPQSPLPQHISRAPEVRLKHWQNDILVQFAALHFKNPVEYRYRYRLEPESDTWIDIGERREVYFTGLAPGQHTLWVQVANADGTWSDKDIQLRMIVLRPWWASILAFVIYGLIAAVLAYAFYRFQLRRRLAEADRRRLEELDAFKNRVFTNITHEFRTPLTIILGLADRLRGRAARMLHPDLKSIERQGNRLLRLVNSMLDLAQLEAGRLNFAPVQSDIHFFLRYAGEALRSYAQEQELALRIGVFDEPFFMDFDPARLEQVVTNLMTNAIKFTPAGGTVVLTGEVLEGDTYRIEVADTGPGIPPELQDKIFTRFFRVGEAGNTQRTHPNEGTGIGLALCRELVELMGGTISVSSELGQGARFVIELPVTRQAPRHKEPPTLQAEPHSAEAVLSAIPQPESSPAATDVEELPLVLIVEDHATLRKYIRECLAERFQIIEAADGQAGLEQAREHTPDLIVSDVMMPELDGFELCSRLKEDPGTSHIPIVLLTAKADAQSRLEGRRRGAEAYLAKPFLAAELQLVVRNLLEQVRRLQTYFQSLATGQSTPPAPEAAPEEAAFVTEVREYLLAHLADAELNVTALAEALHLGRVQLYRKLKSLADLTPVELIRDVRLGHAKDLLRTTDLQIAEIAYECGYADPGFFGRVFKEVVGRTPTEFREGEN